MMCVSVKRCNANMNFANRDYGHAGGLRFTSASSLSAECQVYLKLVSQPCQLSVEVHFPGTLYLCTVDTFYFLILIVYMGIAFFFNLYFLQASYSLLS